MNNNITILISHDSRDEKIASELKSFLEGIFLNIHFYVSGRDIKAGQVWVEQIKSKLKSSQIIISLITTKSLNNNWVYFESGAGFTDDKTIPLLTDNLKPENLVPPLSLLQARVLSDTGIETLIKDISEKLDLREPRNYPGIKALTNKIDKLLNLESLLELKHMLSKNNAVPKSAKQWIYKENCLVHDFVVEKKYRVSVDTYFSIDKSEIQLFGREGSEDYVLNIVSKAKNFLPQPFDQYITKGNRLIFQSFESNEKIETLEKSLADLLNRIENYKNQIDTD